MSLLPQINSLTETDLMLRNYSVATVKNHSVVAQLSVTYDEICDVRSEYRICLNHCKLFVVDLKIFRRL